ncbi:MAG: hypothetical protein L0287_04340 [Anaerolineae bacterium]|nr:hypothetical protein [Anaerolineae bacterium]
MKRITITLTLIMLATACTPAPTAVPADSVVVLTATDEPAAASAPTEAPVNPKLPAASFESETYINEEIGFALDYPAGWTVNESIVGDRGSQVQFLSSPEIAESAVLPEGASRVTAVIYDWEPKNDLPAYIANWKTAWESSGFTVVEEQPLVLDLGLNAVQFTIKTPDSSAVVLITALGDKYMVLSGEGNLDLSKEIVQRLRPISVR